MRCLKCALVYRCNKGALSISCFVNNRLGIQDADLKGGKRGGHNGCARRYKSMQIMIRESHAHMLWHIWHRDNMAGAPTGHNWGPGLVDSRGLGLLNSQQTYCVDNAKI